MVGLQTNAQINRAYATFGLGTRWTPDMGFFVHGFDHLSAGIFHTFDNEPAPGPYYYDHSFPFSKLQQFKNHSESTSLLLGVTTNMQDIVDLSFLAGPSFSNYITYTDIQVKENNYGYEYFSSYTRNDYNAIGLNARADVSLTFSRYFGLNIALETNRNKQVNYFRFIVGLNFGILRNINRYR